MTNNYKRLTIFSLIIFLIPVFGFAQTNAPTLPNIGEGISAPVSGFADSLKGVLTNGLSGISMPASGGSGVSLDLSSIGSAWESVNNWFSANIGISFKDIIKTAVSVLIWFWEILIKLIKAGVEQL